MPRNVSESQLVQIGSKAFSNVAGQFSKLSQSLTPKVRVGKKVGNNSNSHIVYNPSSIVIDQGIEQSLEKENLSRKDGDSSESDDNDCSIYEPDNSDLVQENPIYNENAFLPSVGIVMAATEIPSSTDQKEKLPEMRKMSADLPATLGKPACSSVRSASPAPEIHIHEIDEGKNLANSSGQKFCHSAVEMRLNESFAGGSK